MAHNFFRDDVLPQLEAASNDGDSTNEMSTRLIGHSPKIAPKAYVHVVYAPLPAAELLELRERLGRPIPRVYEEFLACANGLSLFTGSLRVLGYVPLNRRASTHPHNYPSTVIIPNVQARLRGITHEAVVVGWREEDNSYFAIERDGVVIRVGSSPVESWPNFETWLTAVIRLQAAARSTSAERVH